MPAPKNNRHAAKSAKLRASKSLNFRVKPSRLAAWKAANDAWARTVGLDPERSMTSWITIQCDRAAGFIA